MEYRNDLAGILLAGLPNDERDHVVDVIQRSDAEKLRRKREVGEVSVPQQDEGLGGAGLDSDGEAGFDPAFDVDDETASA